ncbi:MAG: ABC transporter permease [Syntrophomonadaceae bacterium]|nr:ABC transporter permease [Syntrophomonadaceae bacterium]
MMAWLRRFYIWLIFFFLYAPILVLVLFSFNDSRSRSSWDGFTLHWYADLFANQQLMTALYNTIAIAIVSALVATVLGTVAAIGIQRMRGFKHSLTMNLTYLPILNPDIVTGISMMMFFIAVSIPRGMTSMMLAHITFCLPFVIIVVLPKLKQMDPLLYDAALDLGATPSKAYRSVIIPQILPSILVGFLLAFTMSVDDFVISFFVTGNGVNNLSIAIYTMAKRGISPSINAVMTLILVAVLIAVALVYYYVSHNKKITEKGWDI